MAEFNVKFEESIKKELLAKGIIVETNLQQITKPNQSYESIVVKPKDSEIGVTLNIDAYSDWISEGVDYDAAVSKAAESIINALKNAPNINAAEITDYSSMKEKLVVELIQTASNKDLLEKIPHKEILDMSIVFRFDLEDKMDSSVTTLVTNNMLELMKITPEQLLVDALENSPRVRPLRVSSLFDLVSKYWGEDEANMIGNIKNDCEEEQIYVCSNKNSINGAGVLVYPGFLRSLSERIGGKNLFILPSSRHEIIVIPADYGMSVSNLHDMVREVNEMNVEPVDKLTDNVYVYNWEKDSLTIADTEDECEP